MKSWFVVHTQPRKEEVATENLIRQGFEIYYPQCKKIRKHARRVTEVVSPLFPRYLFIAFDKEHTQWRCINSTRGVSYLITSKSGIPCILDQEIVDDIKSKEQENGLVDIMHLQIFEHGQRVFIKDGAFKNQVGEYIFMDDKYRVEVLINILGKPTKVKVDLQQVEAA